MLQAIEQADAAYPVLLRERLGGQTPTRLTALGNLDLLKTPKTALFCSAKCPGNAILASHDAAAAWRDAARCIISGFHSPVEKECLLILLRGSQPIIICPARSLEGMRLPAEWKAALESRRLLILSGFDAAHRRVTMDLATQRNVLVAALADEAWFAHIEPGSKSEHLAAQIRNWGIPIGMRWQATQSLNPEIGN